MGTTGFQANYVTLIPTAPTFVPNGSYFVDSTNGNASSFKGIAGGVSVLDNPAAQLVIKQKQAAAIYPINTPVAVRPDGMVEIADANAMDGQELIGVLLEASVSVGALVNVLLVGANIPNALNGLGFSVGDEIYVSETGGYTNNPASLTTTDAIVKVGVADCSAGNASATANDLILFPDVVSSNG